MSAIYSQARFIKDNITHFTYNHSDNMQHLKTLIASATLLLTAGSAQAQHTESGYFNDGYLFRHEMNPAFGNDRNYVSMPGLGNMDFSLHGNLSVKDLLYNVNGRTALFTNPQVNASEFLGNISDRNQVGTDIKLQILGGGFKAWGGYNTIGINVRMNEETDIPGTFFQLAKEGLTNNTYDIKDLKAHSDAYVEIALGHSRQINKQWRVGGALKVLLGGGNVDASFDKAELALNGDHWTAVTNATVNSSVKGLTYKTETTMRGPEGKETPHTYVSDVDVDGAGLNGFGLALDLGAEFQLNDDWRFSAAVLDLGFLSWSNNMMASTRGDRTFDLDRYTFNADDNADNSFSKEGDRLAADLATLYELQDCGDQGSRTTGLAATLNLGAEYTLPVYRKMTFGVLNTTRINGSFSWTDFRFSANWKPFRVFSMGANFSAGTNGCGFGWIINAHPKGFNFFLAMDNTFARLAKQGVPLSSNASVTMGINFPF